MDKKIRAKRIDWIDISKGLTILLVIIGHSDIRSVLRGAIFSFHMPLFFILSSTTYKCSTNNDELLNKSEKAFLHLFLAVIGIYLIKTTITIIIDFTYLSSLPLYNIKIYVGNIINVFIVGSGVPTNIGNTVIEPIGIPWFLMVLFFGRCLFDYLHLKLNNKWFYTSIVLFSIIGLCLGKIQWLPFSFDIALAIQLFFLFGQWLKNYNMEKEALKTIIISSIIWSSLFLYTYIIKNSYLELACRCYPLFPICYIYAISGTMMLSSFSQIISKFDFLCGPIKYLGRNSLIMLWVHCFDKYFEFAYRLSSHGLVNAIIRIVIDLGIFALIILLIDHEKFWCKFRKKTDM